MLELISIIASIVLIVVTPIQTAQICAGKISPKYKGTPEAYAAAFRKQIGLLVWLGAVFAVLNLVLIFIASEPGEWIVESGRRDAVARRLRGELPLAPAARQIASTDRAGGLPHLAVPCSVCASMP